jgi:hypothetical protein
MLAAIAGANILSGKPNASQTVLEVRAGKLSELLQTIRRES